MSRRVRFVTERLKFAPFVLHTMWPLRDGHRPFCPDGRRVYARLTGDRDEVPLQPLPAEVLRFLAIHREKFVSRRTLGEVIRGLANVDPSWETVRRVIHLTRRALDVVHESGGRRCSRRSTTRSTSAGSTI